MADENFHGTACELLSKYSEAILKSPSTKLIIKLLL